MTQTEQIAQIIMRYLKSQRESGIKHVDLTAGQVGKMVGLSNRTPMCIGAMKIATEHFGYEVIHDVPSGQSTTVEYRYFLF
jgi:hypothetical protein